MAVRLLALSLIMLLALPPGSGRAGQASASFTVGLVIGKPQGRAPRPAFSLRRTYTWNAAAISVRLAGYRTPVRLKAAAGAYWFLAERGGRRFRIAVSTATGAILMTARAI